MSKTTWKPGNMLYPLPVVLVSCGDTLENYNIITVAWTGTLCTNPPMTYVSLRKSRHSYEIIKRTKSFVINLSTERLVKAVDFCGVKSGKTIDKFKTMHLTPEKATEIKAPCIKESPVNLECRVEKMVPLGSHDMFMAQIVSVHVDEAYLDQNNKFHLDQTKPICYSHGQYYNLGQNLGHFGFSVKKKR